MKVFKRADDKYRSGQADKRAAKGLYAAGYFLAVLKQFGPLEARVDNVRKYSLLHASKILKALKQGRTPVAPADFGGSDGDDARAPATTLPSSNVGDDALKIPGFDDNDSGAKVADPGAANAGGGFLDIPAAPGFGDDESGKVSSGGGCGGFLDIPAAPGFEDDNRKAVSGGAGGLPDIPAAPGFEDAGGLPDIPAAPGFEDAGGLPDIPAAPGFEDAGGLPDIPAAPGFEDDATVPTPAPTKNRSETAEQKAERLRSEADAFFAKNQAKRALKAYLGALDLFMVALKKESKGTPAWTALYKKMDLMMRNAEKMKGMLKLVPKIADKLAATLAPLLVVSSFSNASCKEASLVLAGAVADDKEEHYVAAQRDYKKALTLFMAGSKKESADVRKILFSKLGLVMSRAEALKKSGF